MAHKTHIIKIQNLSNGDVLIFKDSYIQNYSFKRIVNWDSTNTIGRMDPIKTFKNTEAKVEVSFTVVNPHRNIINYTFFKQRETDSNYTKQELNNFFENPIKKDNKTTGVYGYTENLNTIGKILYPSYTAHKNIAEREQHFFEYTMKSAPVLRVGIYKDGMKDIKIFEGYATVNALDVNLKGEDVSSPSGREFSNIEFNILFDVIHVNPGQISSAEFSPPVTSSEVLNSDVPQSGGSTS